VRYIEPVNLHVKHDESGRACIAGVFKVTGTQRPVGVRQRSLRSCRFGHVRAANNPAKRSAGNVHGGSSASSAAALQGGQTNINQRNECIMSRLATKQPEELEAK